MTTDSQRNRGGILFTAHHGGSEEKSPGFSAQNAHTARARTRCLDAPVLALSGRING